MKENNIQKAERIAAKCVEHLYRQFEQHPEYRGPKFTWEKFPQMAADLAEVSCYQSFSHNTKKMSLLESAAQAGTFTDTVMERCLTTLTRER